MNSRQDQVQMAAGRIREEADVEGFTCASVSCLVLMAEVHDLMGDSRTRSTTYYSSTKHISLTSTEGR